MGQAKAEAPPLFDRPRPAFDRPRAPQRAGNGKAFVPMSPKATEVAGRLKEMFHAYSNRLERSQQATMGPSEIGSPCDRRIAMSLMRLPPVNSGGDNWASFVGTQIHRGLEDMFVWANAGSGRYQTEVKLNFPSKYVPKGTTDLIDTFLLMVDDHKCMGSWSYGKLTTEGPSRVYRVQAHSYGYGAKLAGWDIKDVAIIAWPRDKSSLDDLYVWTEPYQPSIAREALDRVARIGDAIAVPQGEVATMMADPPKSYMDFPIDPSDCRYCPFYLKGAAKSGEGVCNGRE